MKNYNLKSRILLCLIVFSLSCCKKEGAAQVLENEIEDKTVDVTQSNPPILKTPSPVIHLADNLDEKDFQKLLPLHLLTNPSGVLAQAIK